MTLGLRYDRTAATMVTVLLLAIPLINLRRLAQTQIQARRTAREVAAYQTTANNPRVPTE